MGPDPKIIDDIARLAGGAANILSSLQQQIKDEIKSRMEEMADRMDLVPRDDVLILQATIRKLEKNQNALTKRIEKLEAASKKTSTSKSKKSPSKKAAAKKAASKKSKSGSKKKKS